MKREGHSPIRYQPILLEGIGVVKFGPKVYFGVDQSPTFYNSYAYLNTRSSSSVISFGGNNWINNNFSIVCEGEGVEIGSYTIIGENVRIFDSDFHNIDPKRRMVPVDKTAKVKIGNNVWIGNNVTILKGVHIGDNSIIANGAVVSKNIPTNTIAGGIPAKIIKKIE